MIRLVFLVIFLLVFAACSSNGDVTSTARNTSATAIQTATASPASQITASQATATTAPATPSAPSMQQLTIVKSGFTQEGNYLTYGYLLKNESTSHAAESVTVNLTLYDPAGAVIQTESNRFAIVFPGQTVARGLYMPVDREGVTVDRIGLQARAARWIDWNSPVPEFSVFNVSAARWASRGWQVTGEVQNPLNQDVEGLGVAAIFLDSQGNVLGGQGTFLDAIPAGGTAAFEIIQAVGLSYNDIQLFVILTDAAIRAMR